MSGLINKVRAVFDSIYSRPPSYYNYNRPLTSHDDEPVGNDEIRNDIVPVSEGDDVTGLWVFGYGSLMWQPNFPYLEKLQARAVGVQRSFCIQSIHYRGSYKAPGVVLGLCHGQVCDGVAFKVAKSDAKDVINTLRKREQITDVYREVFRNVDLNDGSGRRVRALCYLANETHKQYVGHYSPAKKAAIIKQSSGASGSNLDYLMSTIRHLDELGIVDDELRRLLVLTGCSYRMT